MPTHKTIFEWRYEPRDYFEAPFVVKSPDYDLAIGDGTATTTLSRSQDPVPEELRQAIESRIELAFRARELQIHQKYTLRNPTTRQERSDGTRTCSLSLTSNVFFVAARTPDVIVTDAQGRIMKDTKAERIEADEKSRGLISDAALKCPLVLQLLRSYHAAVEDPDNEFMHLYEIREALKGHFRSKKVAKRQLSISEAEWSRLGLLANEEPVQQSRHRGKHGPALRTATFKELEEVRCIARKMVENFARTVK